MTIDDAHYLTARRTVRRPSAAARLWRYQEQRLPLRSQGLLIALFALACVCFGAVSRAEASAPSVAAILVALTCVLIAFFQLRVADEHRDAAEDARSRPYLPVPSGLVSLGELRAAAALGAGAQLIVTLALHPPLVALLFPIWAYIALVAIDFGAGRALKRRPAMSLALHLGFTPLLGLFAVATDQLPRIGGLSPGMLPFFVLAATAAATLEIARKCIAAEDERIDVRTYSLIWGPSSAGLLCAAAMVVSLVLAFLAFLGTRTPGLYFLPVIAIGATAFLSAIIYAQAPTRPWSLLLRRMSGALIAAIYAGIGLVPFLVHLAGR